MTGPSPDGMRPYTAGTFLHLPGVGERICRRLREYGIGSWGTVPSECPGGLPELRVGWAGFRRQVGLSWERLRSGDWGFFLERLPCSERWRILADCWEQVVYLDIETSALDHAATVTAVSCWDGRRPRLFLQGEDLEDFPDYAENVKAFATFNGSSFDFPRLRACFHVPEFFSGIHLDLRWIFRRAGWTGGLKSIETAQGVLRPRDLLETGGCEAVELWEQWRAAGAPDARRRLLRYCAADTITLRQLASILLISKGCPPERFAVRPEEDWERLRQTCPPDYDDDAWKAPRPRPGSAAPAPPEMPRTPPPPAAAEPPPEPADPELLRMQDRLRRFLQRQRNPG